MNGSPEGKDFANHLGYPRHAGAHGAFTPVPREGEDFDIADCKLR